MDRRRRPDRLSQVVVRGGGAQNLSRNLGRLARRRQEIEGQGPADRPDRRAHVRRRAGLVVPEFVVLGRQRGRGRRQDRGPEQPGNHRIGQVRGWTLERRLRRGRACLGRHQQQPRFPGGHHLRHQQRRLDLYRSQEKAGCVSDREGRADVAGHLARAHPQGRRRAVQPAGPLHPHADGLFQEPKTGQGFPALDPLETGVQ